jgi:hypothetical protein
MEHWERFTSFKQRGEWVELQFMAHAAKHRFAVSKPWGDTQAYDVGVEHRENFLRVQVKSCSRRKGAGYYCKFQPHPNKKQAYSLEQIDLFAAYVIPDDVWYLIPLRCCWVPGVSGRPFCAPSSLPLRGPATATNATGKPGTCPPEPAPS